MKQSLFVYLCFLFLTGSRLPADDRLVVNPGVYTEEAMSVSIAVEEIGTDQIRFTISYRAKHKDDGISRSIGVSETQGVAAPLKVKSGRWAFCIEAPNIVWFYDGKVRLSLWTVNEERGLSGVESTVEKSSNIPGVLRDWIRK